MSSGSRGGGSSSLVIRQAVKSRNRQSFQVSRVSPHFLTPPRTLTTVTKQFPYCVSGAVVAIRLPTPDPRHHVLVGEPDRRFLHHFGVARQTGISIEWSIIPRRRHAEFMTLARLVPMPIRLIVLNYFMSYLYLKTDRFDSIDLYRAILLCEIIIFPTSRRILHVFIFLGCNVSRIVGPRWYFARVQIPKQETSRIVRSILTY